jgi:hypothetical protein
MTAVSLLATQTPAQASPACLGCNVSDEGSFNNSLIGQTVYVASNTYRVTGIDRTGGYVYLTDTYGAAKWSRASETYTAGAQRERSNITAGVVLTAGAMFLAAMFNGSGGGSSGGYSNNRNNSSRTTEYVYRSTPTYRSPSPTHTPSPTTTQSTPGFYGNCHGGSFYSC